jgi:hypothetical protein
VILLTVGANDGFAASSKLTKTCTSLNELQDDISEVAADFEGGDFDGNAFTQLGNAFTKASKSAPKGVRSSLNQLAKFYKSIGNAGDAQQASLQLGKNTKKYSQDATNFATFYATKCPGGSGSSGSGSPPSGGGTAGGGGTLTIGDTTIELDSSTCSQAPAGQQIELSANASGTTADGKNVTVDFTRYMKGGTFEGDDVQVLIGEAGATDAAIYNDRRDYGEVNSSRSTLTMSETEMTNLYAGTSTTISFEIECATR